ncbi:MAG: peroxiredoxin [Myxococcales bacterium]|nr:peroxiredoxin [Myxococcales bacterium]
MAVLRVYICGMRSALSLLAVVGLLACAGTSHTMLGPGAPAPDVVGVGANGTAVRLSERRGHPAVVYFYPKDQTPGCTREACAFRDAFDRYVAARITVFGVSRDDLASHAAFQKEYQLPFPLVADVDGRVQAAYGVPGRMGMAARVTFLIDPTGKIAHVWSDVDPGVHADQVLAQIERLGY